MQKWPPPHPSQWKLNEVSTVKRLCLKVMVKLYARAKWMASVAATDISTSCVVETDSVRVGSLECVVGGTTGFSCIDNIASFILAPPPPQLPLEGFYITQTAISGFLFVDTFFSSRHKSQFPASHTPLCGHPLNTDTSRTVRFVPGERKPLHFL